jgi:predicted Zn-dependent protease
MPVLALALLLAACTTYNPATGQQEFTPFMSPDQEQALGVKEHPKLVKDNGGVYDNPQLGGYIATIGGKLAATTETKDQKFTFTLLNTSLVNAFAMPGGYVYITRGILAYINSEAELASVLGHEIGHVVAHHTAQRYSKQVMAGLFSGVVGAVLGSPGASDLMNYGSQIYILGYSRDQEYQADGLGVRYMARAGYDPYAAGDMLHMLGAQDELEDIVAHNEGRERQSEFFSTHPKSENRVEKALKLAEDSGIKPGQQPRFKDELLNAVDGMIFGDDPSQGLIRGQVYWHPGLLLTFTAPDGFSLNNSESGLMMKGPSGAAAIFSGKKIRANTTTQDYMEKTWHKIDARDQLQDIQAITINGMEALTGWTEASTAKLGRVTARLVAIRYSPTQAFYFFMMAPGGQMAALQPGFERMTYGFRKLKAAEAGKIKPYRIKVVTVKKRDTPQTMAQRMAMPDYQLERFLVLNGLGKEAELEPGSRVKIIVAE